MIHMGSGFLRTTWLKWKMQPELSMPGNTVRKLLIIDEGLNL